MTSLTRMLHGVASARRQGKSRAWLEYQSTIRGIAVEPCPGIGGVSKERAIAFGIVPRVPEPGITRSRHRLGLWYYAQ